MTADFVALEARVAELERQMRHVLPAKIDAANYAISLVHEDTRAIRESQQAMRESQQAMLESQQAMLETQEAMRESQEAMRESQQAMRETQEATLEKQGKHGTILEEILRRLPAEPEA